MMASARAWTKPGMKTVSGVAKLVRPDSPCSSYCCHLALPCDTNCISNCSSLGGSLYVWGCCIYPSLYNCVECTTGSSCYQGTFKCSQATFAGVYC